MKTYRLKFITPCFCGGASPIVAEIRAPSIRGELRWWFRCLGGSAAQERTIFGGVAGTAAASSLLVRVSGISGDAVPYSPDYKKLEDPGNYLHYWLTAPNANGDSRMWETPPDGKHQKGVIRPESQISPGISFDLSLHRHRHGSAEEEALLNRAVECLLNFGCVGFRKTRGFGAWVVSPADSLPTRGELEQLLKNLPDGFSSKLEAASNPDPLQALRQVETKLKADKLAGTGLRLNHKAKDKTPLGYSHGSDRQASAVHFRPVAFKTKAGVAQFSLLTFQAPDTVLGDDVKSAYSGATRLVP